MKEVAFLVKGLKLLKLKCEFLALPDLQGNMKGRKKSRELRITNVLGVALVCCAY